MGPSNKNNYNKKKLKIKQPILLIQFIFICNIKGGKNETRIIIKKTK